MQSVVDALRRIGSTAMLAGDLGQARGILLALEALETTLNRSSDGTSEDPEGAPQPAQSPEPVTGGGPSPVDPCPDPTSDPSPSPMVSSENRPEPTEQPEPVDIPPEPNGAPEPPRDGAALPTGLRKCLKGLRGVEAKMRASADEYRTQNPFPMISAVWGVAAIAQEARAAGIDGDADWRKAMKATKSVWDAATKKRPSRAWSQKFTADAALLRELAEALADCHAGSLLVKGLSPGQRPGVETWEPYLAACAVQAWANRTANSLNVREELPELEGLHAKLVSLKSEDAYVPYWNLTGHGALSDSEVRTQAQANLGLLAVASKGPAKRPDRSRHLAAIRELIGSGGADFEAQLVAIVKEAILDRMRPTDKDLLALLEGYEAVLASASEAALGSLVRALGGASARRLGSKERPAPVSSEEDVLEQFPDVVEYMAGKKLLFVGGRKGQTARIPKYKVALRLADFEWPDMETHSNPAQLSPAVSKADVVVYLIRFSRHSYKKAIDEAKAQGKAVVTLPSGQSLAQLAHAVREQVLPARQ